MKTLVIIIVLACSTSLLWAEEETLFHSKLTHGYYIGLSVKPTSLNHEYATFVGVQGAWIINHRFSLGAGVYGLGTENGYFAPESDAGTPWDDARYLNVSYGGFLLGYIAHSDRLSHVSLDCLIGGGTLELSREPDGGTLPESDGFTVIEPTANLELNLSRLFRLNVGCGYRHVIGISHFRMGNDQIGGPVLSLVLKFGRF